MFFCPRSNDRTLERRFLCLGISEDGSNPEHLFRVTGKSEIGIFGTQIGLISLYSKDYPSIP